MTAAQLLHEQQQLQEELLYLQHSPRNRARRLHTRLQRLSALGNPALTRTFLKETGAQFLVTIPELPALGCTPDFLAALYEDVAVLRTTLVDTFDAEELLPAEDHLLYLQRSVYAWLGMPGRTEGVDQKRLASLTERERLDEYCSMLQQQDDTQAMHYARIASEWDAVIQSRPGTVNIPLLEHDLTNGGIHDFHAFGTVAQLHVRLSNESAEAGEDVVRYSTDALIPAAVQAELESSLAAIRSSISRRSTGRDVHGRLVLDVSFANHAAFITGRSMGLGVAVCGTVEWTRVHEHREYGCLRNGILFTGRIEGTGMIRALNDELCASKADAFFFSPWAALVLPKENEMAAQTRIDELTAAFPQRNFELVPVRALRDVFNSRIAIDTRQRTISERLRRAFVRNQTRIAGISSVLVILLLAAWYFLIADFDNNPERVILHDNLFTVKNRNGKVLWTEPIGPPENPVADERLAREGMLFSLCFVTDLDGDGANEVILGHPNPKDGFSDSVYCYSADGVKLWGAYMGTSIVTREGDYSNPTGFRIYAVGLIPGDGLRKPRIIATAVNDFYSCTVRVFDIKGKLLGDYLHLGKIQELKIAPEPGRKTHRIVLSGTLNGYLKPVLVVLDPDHVTGVSPQKESHKLISPKRRPGTEVYYISFPVPDLAQVRGDIHTPMATILQANENIVEINSMHGSVPDVLNKGYGPGISLLYLFDAASMRPIHVRSSTQFDTMHERMRQAGLLKSVWNTEYERDLLSRLEYWNGESFQHEPTMNRRYRQLRDSLSISPR